MKNKNFLVPGFIAFLILLSSCRSNIVPVFIDAHRYEVNDFLNLKAGIYKKKKGKTKITTSKDTIVFYGSHDEMPLEILYLFKNDTCFYQEMNIYCSPCADFALNQLLNDKTYKFQALGKKNYVSTKDKNIVMRLTESDHASPNFEDSKTSCHSISIRRINK
ncbi:MAG: hypothetical protein IPN73_10265 [Saprospiraceae bacterium]|nr:hypothetical protein [Saprospiraceae bacterium]